VNRNITETLDLCWELLSILPADTLTRVNEEDIAKYYIASNAEL